MNKEREINDSPEDKINPDEVRIEKLEKIVGHFYNLIKPPMSICFPNALDCCMNDINCQVSEDYTAREITNALMEWFDSEELIRFFVINYTENL